MRSASFIHRAEATVLMEAHRAIRLLGNSVLGLITAIGISLVEEVTDTDRSFFRLMEQHRVVSRLHPFDADPGVVPRDVFSEFSAAWDHALFDRTGCDRA